MSIQWPEHVLILSEGSTTGGDFGLSFAEGFRAHGCEVTLANRAGQWDSHFDLALAYGPFGLGGSMIPVAQRLATLPRTNRLIFIWWLTEGIPNPRYPRWLVQAAAKLRVGLDNWVRRRTVGLQDSQKRAGMAGLWTRGHRLRIFGELRWLQSQGVLDVLAVTSASRARYLRAAGFEPLVVPLGYHPGYYGRDLRLEREQDVCFIGSTVASRRKKLLALVQGELKKQGIEVAVANNLYGEARTHFLNTTKIMLNIQRAPQDFVGQRFLLGAANKILVISEPVRDTEPFRAGQHVVVAPIEELADTVEYYLNDHTARKQIVDTAHRFVTEELTIETMVAQIIEHARAVQQKRSAVG